MKILILKDVISGQEGWRREGEIHELEPKLANHYIKRGIGIPAPEEEKKEEKVQPETKEAKAPKKRTTKKAK